MEQYSLIRYTVWNPYNRAVTSGHESNRLCFLGGALGPDYASQVRYVSWVGSWSFLYIPVGILVRGCAAWVGSGSWLLFLGEIWVIVLLPAWAHGPSQHLERSSIIPGGFKLEIHLPKVWIWVLAFCVSHRFQIPECTIQKSVHLRHLAEALTSSDLHLPHYTAES